MKGLFIDIQWVDLDGVGQCERVSGKRFWAQNGRLDVVVPGKDGLGVYENLGS